MMFISQAAQTGEKGFDSGVALLCPFWQMMETGDDV